MKSKIYSVVWLLAACLGALAQSSPYSNNIFTPQVFIATGQTGAPIQLNGLTTSTSTVGSSYTVGNITATGTSLTTATFSIGGSSDNGANYYLLPIYAVASPTSTPATTVTITGNGLYQVNLAGMTHVEFLTSGTFNATNLTLTLTATPNGILARGGNGTGGGGITGCVGYLFGAGSTYACNPNVPYSALSGVPPLWNQNTSGNAATASALGVISALPNGTTASTQATGDNSTKVATDAFVLANSSMGGVTDVSLGAWPSWITPTISNPTTTPSIAVAVTAIPNAALANSGFMVNGVPWVLGGAYSVTSGGTPGGTTGSAQYNNGGSFGGLNGSGLYQLNGAAPPTVATSANVRSSIGSGVYDAAGAAAAAAAAANATTINGAAVPISASGTATDSSGHIIQQTAGNISTILGFTPVGSPNFTGNLATGVLADYDFAEGSGTTLLDISGANACGGSPCNGTFGGGSSTAPAWLGTQGVAFSVSSQGITLPATLNSVKTIVVAYYDTPISTAPNNTGTWSGNYAPLISSSLGSAGINLIQAAPCSSTYPNGLYQYVIWNGNCTTIPTNFGAGFHIATYVLGTGSGNLDHIYLEGTETPYYLQGSNAGAQTSGNLFIGSSNTGPWANQGAVTRIYYRMRLFSTQLGAADVQQISQIFRQVASSRGVQVAPVSQNIALAQLHGDGDSQMQGSGVATPYISELTLTNQPTYQINNWGLGGMSLQGMTASDKFRIGQQCDTSFGTPSVVLLMGGTNDASQNSAYTAAQWGAHTFQNLAGNIQTLRNSGCIVFVGTMMSRYGSDPKGNTYDADKDFYNVQIRQNAVVAGAAGVFDMAAVIALGQDGAAPSAGNTYFQSGGLHTTQLGTNLEAAAVSAAMNAYFGTTAAAPTMATTATYSMLTGDTYLLAAPTGAQTITLPDCTGQSGAKYTINNSQSTYAVTLKTLLSIQPINGIDYSSTGTIIPANSSYQVTDRPLPLSTSGCVWMH